MRTIVRWNTTGEGGRKLKGVKWQLVAPRHIHFNALISTRNFAKRLPPNSNYILNFPESCCLCTMVAGAVTSSDLLEVSGCERPFSQGRTHAARNARVLDAQIPRTLADADCQTHGKRESGGVARISNHVLAIQWPRISN